MYVNTTFNEMLNDNWMFQTGVALNTDRENIRPGDDELFTTKKNGQVKFTFTNTSGKNLTTKIGTEYMFYDYRQDIRMDENFQLAFSNNQYSAFIESELKATRHIALKAGLRAEHHSLIKKTNAVPRLSAAVKTGKFSQLSAAYGQRRPDRSSSQAPYAAAASSDSFGGASSAPLVRNASPGGSPRGRRGAAAPSGTAQPGPPQA